MEYFEKLKLQAVVFESIKRRYEKAEYLYQIGFSYDEVNDMGYGLKKKL